MDQHQRINQLFDELEQPAPNLKTSPEAPERRELLRDMRFALEEADRLILPKSNSANA